MAFNLLNILPTALPLAIEPSLQAAAQLMSVVEFNSMTEQVRDHLLAGNHERLALLLQGHGIHHSCEVVQQIATGRLMFFGEKIAYRLQTVEDGVPYLGEAERGELAPSAFLQRLHKALVKAIAEERTLSIQELHEAGLHLGEAERGELAPSAFLQRVHETLVEAIAEERSPSAQELYEAGLHLITPSSSR